MMRAATAWVRWTCVVLTIAIATGGAFPSPCAGDEVRQVTPVPSAVREKFNLAPFYAKHVDADGLAILSSEKVSDAALLEAAYLIDKMLASRDDVRRELVSRRVRFTVMAPTEMTTDVPEQSHMDSEYWDARARGLGGRLCSCGEENLLNLQGDRYPNENILIHEFSHTIHNYGLRRMDVLFNARLRLAHQQALKAGLWEDTYAATNIDEYWAEGVQSYFDTNAPPQKGIHNDVNTRDELKQYDRALFDLIDESFKGTPWRYVRYDKRQREGEKTEASGAETSTFPPKVSLDEIRQRISEVPKQHPRLLVTREQLADLKEAVNRDPLKRQLADFVIAEADALADVPPIERKLEGKRLLHESRRCLRRTLVLATAFHLTGDQQYVERCRDELLAAARFSDWNPSHFLDVAEMTFALAIGYDWLYDELDAPAREEIRKAIVEKGLRLQFAGNNGWARLRNNWGQVCHGGLTAGAIAVLEDEPELTAKTVHSALSNVPHAMGEYAPRGGYPEGPRYWSYGTSFNVLLIEALVKVFGSDFGLSHAPGFDETGGFLALATGPSGLFFNYADGAATRNPEISLFWFASRFDRLDWLNGERMRWREHFLPENREEKPEGDRFYPLALLWIVDANDANVRLPLSWSSGGKVPVTVHRSSWTDPRATFVGLKGGSPAASHGQMDTGSFVLDSDGIRWAVDLGPENYHAIESRGMNLWSNAQNSDRWKIFRLNNLGHSTLVIDNKLQVVAGNAPIVNFSDDSQRPFSIVDLAPVYRDQVESARRGVSLLPSREVLVQDELTGLKPESRVRWGMITAAEPSAAGSREMVLLQSDKKLTLHIVSPADAVWTKVNTATPQNEWDSPNPGTTMLAIEATAPASGELSFVVTATPGTCEKPEASTNPVVPLHNWGKE